MIVGWSACGGRLAAHGLDAQVVLVALHGQRQADVYPREHAPSVSAAAVVSPAAADMTAIGK
jgi:hypothetical protein